MNDEAAMAIVETFIGTNRLQSYTIAPKARSLIAHAAAPYYLFAECLTPYGVDSSPDPVDGLILTLADRLFRTLSTGVVLVIRGNVQHAEILSRTTMESAISLLYTVEADTQARAIAYLCDYIRQERVQNRKWKNELTSSPKPVQLEHWRKIVDKESSLDAYESLVKRVAEAVHCPYPPNTSWPIFYDICVKLGKGTDYRTVYMAMCSQTHHDAEDVLNILAADIVPGVNDMSIRTSRMTDNFSIFLVLYGVQYFLEAMEKLGRYYRMDSVVEQSAKGQTVLTELLLDVEAGGFLTNDPCEWTVHGNTKSTLEDTARKLADPQH